MKPYFALTIGALGAIAACTHHAAQVQSGGEVVTTTTPATASVLPVGTTMTARVNQTLGGSASREGDQFTATVTNAVVAQNGATAIPAGATLFGRVTGMHDANSPADQAVIRLAFDSIAFNGRAFPFGGNVSNVAVRSESGAASTSNAVRGSVAGGAVGAVAGAIISGGELNRVLTTGILGAAAGTVISLGVGTNHAVIPAGTNMTVRSTQEVRVR